MEPLFLSTKTIFINDTQNNSPFSVCYRAGAQCFPQCLSWQSWVRGNTWALLETAPKATQAPRSDSEQQNSQNHLRSTSKILIAGAKPPQPALHRQPGQVLLVQPQVTHRPRRHRTLPSRMVMMEHWQGWAIGIWRLLHPGLSCKLLPVRSSQPWTSCKC